MAHPDVTLVRVFGAEKATGGNPCPVVMDAQGWSDEQMQSVAKEYGHESAFVVPTPEVSEADFVLKFWVPRHEMEMCGHATLASLWLLAKYGRVQPGIVRVATESGLVLGQVSRDDRNQDDFRIELLQSLGQIYDIPTLHKKAILSVLGVGKQCLAEMAIANASTLPVSRP